jgi:hypothetical protein
MPDTWPATPTEHPTDPRRKSKGPAKEDPDVYPSTAMPDQLSYMRAGGGDADDPNRLRPRVLNKRHEAWTAVGAG